MSNPSFTLQRTSGHAFLWALLVSAALLVLDLGTASLYPTTWCDEVSFSEPAINLATRGTFTTSVWPAQPAGTFWAANAPLYPLLLSLWARLLGQSALAIHSLNYLFITIAAFLVWWGAGRFRLATHPATRLLLIPLLHCGYSVSIAYRCSRPDVLGVILLLLFMISLSCRAAWRGPLAALAAATAVWTGLQLGVWIGMATLLLWSLGWIRWRDVFWIAAGGAISSLLLLSFFQMHQALPHFLASLAMGRNGGVETVISPMAKVKHTFAAYYLDYSRRAHPPGLGFPVS